MHCCNGLNVSALQGKGRCLCCHAWHATSNAKQLRLQDACTALAHCDRYTLHGNSNSGIVPTRVLCCAVTYPYVLKGYRSGGTYSRCLAALFELHTETMNAWTMIVTALLSLVMLYSVVGSESGPATWSEGVAFCALTGSVWLHMPWSVGFHLFRGINPQVYNLWRRLDQVFIFVVSGRSGSR